MLVVDLLFRDSGYFIIHSDIGVSMSQVSSLEKMHVY